MLKHSIGSAIHLSQAIALFVLPIGSWVLEIDILTTAWFLAQTGNALALTLDTALEQQPNFSLYLS